MITEKYRRRMRKFRNRLNKKKISLKSYKNSVAFWTKMYHDDINNRNRWNKAKNTFGEKNHVNFMNEQFRVISFQQG